MARARLIESRAPPVVAAGRAIGRSGDDGVSTVGTYEVKGFDSDYFSEE